jgi:peptidoglycan/xylan/chitin deacetylase (PgdA/CDA1 family)/CelD/BcsL family acetyltransferase involved in cellulose biosynthesis
MLEVTQHKSWDKLELLQPEWNRVLASSGTDTFFLTWEWISAWWKNYGNKRLLFTLTARDQNKLVAVAPFYLDSVHRLGANWNCLKLIGDGSGDSDYQDIFAEAGREKEAVSAFVDFLQEHRTEWDTLEFESTPEKSTCLGALRAAAGEKSWRIDIENVACSTIRLLPRWDDYLQSLKPRLRSKVRSSLAFLEKQMRTVPVTCSGAEQLDEWLPILFDLHTRRWQEAGKPGVFRNLSKRNFYHDISLASLEKGWLAFHRLDWGERALAMQYGFIYKNQFLLLQEGYDPAFESLRPGQTLRAWLLRHWMESGLAEYDFLAGAAKHKAEWGAQQKLSLRVRATPKRSSMLVFHDLPGTSIAAKEHLRRVIPEALLAWRKRAHERKASRAFAAPTDRPYGSLVRRIARWSIFRAYSSTPLGTVGRHLASNYVWSSRDGSSHGRNLRQRRAPICQILIYHRVNDDNDPFLAASPVGIFQMQMEYIAKHFQVISLDKLASREWARGDEKFYLAVTFDDGYRDNYLNAFPILKRLSIPATIFLTTGCIEKSTLPWYDQVSLGFKLTTRPHLDLRGLGGAEATMDSVETRFLTMKATLEWLWGLPTSERLRRLPELFQALRVPASLNLPNFMLNWDEVREMGKEGIGFGAHTVTHPVLSKTSRESMAKEIQESKKTIELQIRQPVRHFAYPFGRCGDFTADTKVVLREAGFETAVTTIPGYNGTNDDLLELKRFSPWARDSGMFALQMDWRRLVGFTPQEENVRGLFGRNEAEPLPSPLMAAREVGPHVG